MKKLFVKLINLIAGFFSKMSPEIKAVLNIAIWTVEGLKKNIDSPVVDLLTHIIPGNADDILVKQIRSDLPQILLSLKLAKGKFDSAEEIIKTAIEGLNRMPDDIRDAYLHSIALLLCRQNTDLSFGESALAVESYYRKYIKK